MFFFRIFFLYHGQTHNIYTTCVYLLVEKTNSNICTCVCYLLTNIWSLKIYLVLISSEFSWVNRDKGFCLLHFHRHYCLIFQRRIVKFIVFKWLNIYSILMDRQTRLEFTRKSSAPQTWMTGIRVCENVCKFYRFIRIAVTF